MPEQAGRWVGTLAGMMDSPWWPLSVPRWWPLGVARWPVTLELVATCRGVQRVLIIPDRMVRDVLGSLAAVMPGVRADELPRLPPRSGSSVAASYAKPQLSRDTTVAGCSARR